MHPWAVQIFRLTGHQSAFRDIDHIKRNGKQDSQCVYPVWATTIYSNRRYMSDFERCELHYTKYIFASSGRHASEEHPKGKKKKTKTATAECFRYLEIRTQVFPPGSGCVPPPQPRLKCVEGLSLTFPAVGRETTWIESVKFPASSS